MKIRCFDDARAPPIEQNVGGVKHRGSFEVLVSDLARLAFQLQLESFLVAMEQRVTTVLCADQGLSAAWQPAP